MSSKKPVSALQQVLPVKNKPPRDPRFDSLCGEFNEKVCIHNCVLSTIILVFFLSPVPKCYVTGFQSSIWLYK